MSDTATRNPPIPYKFVQRPRERYVEEVEFMLSQGVSPVRIAAGVAPSPGALARALYRAKRPDLARLFNRVAVNPKRRMEW